MRSTWNPGRLLRLAVLLGIAAVLVGVPLAASANPDISGFELDGNAAGSGRADWDALGSPLNFTGFIVDPTDSSDRGYHTGGSKDNNDISQWDWEDGTVTPAKNNIANAYAAVYSEAGNLILYFGQNRVLDRSGDANVGFWFLQNEVGLNDNGTFSGVHAEGDILVQSEFTNGGDVSGIRIGKWTGGDLEFLPNGAAECADGKLGTKDACAIVNGGDISTSWAGTITAPYFFEGGLNLTALFPQQIPCFSTFLTNTRTSQATDARLKDFAAGSIDTCASLEITKQATPSDGTQFGYSTTGGLNPSTFSLADGGSREYKKLQPGTYSVTENAPSGGWALDSLSCPTATGPGTSAQVNGATATITLGFVGHVECTYVNKRKPQVKVVKATVPTTDAGKFDLQINGTTHADDVGNGGDTGFKEVTAGQPVTVGELAGAGTSLDDYVSSVSCDSGKGGANATSHGFSVDFGDKVTCTITNSRKPEVKVVKVTNPTSDLGRFNLLVNGNVERANAMNGQDTGFKQVASGPVTVGESAGTSTSLASYNSKVECDSSKGSTNPGTGHGFTANYGDKVTCTITNTRKASLTVIKHVINDNGGSKAASDFPISVTGSNPSPASFAGAEAPGTIVSIDPGAYNVTETEDPDYAATYSAGCSGTISAGGSATCTITNNDRPPKLTLVKQVVNDNGGTAQASAWTLTAAGPTGFSGAGPSVSSGASFDQGSYDLSESGPAGYDASSWVCSKGQEDGDTVSVSLGDDVTCTITNNDRPATLIVKKVVVNDNGSTKVASDFSFQVNSGAAQSFEADGQNDLTVNAGTYTVTEPAVAGYTTSYSNCSNLVILLGGSATCTITNNDVPRGQGSISVSKSANPVTLKEPGGQVTFSVTITNTSADVDVTITNVVDSVFGDLDDDGGNGCFDVPVNLAPGDKVNCTFQRQVTGQGGTAHVNVVTASGHDENGNSLSASDDARVDITPRLIDLVIVKEATSPTPLNGIVNYTMTVTNKGPDDATNVQVADPAPAGILYLTASPTQGSCTVTQSLITCALGELEAGQTATIRVTARATTVGTHTNTATVTGGGGRETNPADNVDSAITVVPAPARPPVAKPAPKPKPEPEVCLTLTVSPKMITADGRPDRVTVKVTAGKKRMKGMKVSITGAGVKKTGRSNAKGVAVLRVNPRKPGLITITVVESNQRLCGPKRIGVVGVFLPPLTG